MGMLCSTLSDILGRAVVDKTELTAKYDLRLQWTPDEYQTAMLAGMGVPEMTKDTPALDPAGPSMFTALQDQLGLSLQSQREPVEVLVIHHVKKPTDN